MSVQDKIERILKDIHVLFSTSQTAGENKERIVVEKQKMFELLQQLNLAVYEMMDEYEVTSQKHELAERRCEKRCEEIIGRANKQADDIYAASIIYTDDALSRIQHIMEDTNRSVQKIFGRMRTEMDSEKDRVRQNQSELKEQLRDFADTGKYLNVIEEQNREREKELREKIDKSKGRKIPNEGKSYSAIQPEIKINKAYFDQTEMEYEARGDQPEDDLTESLAKVTGKEFAETLRRRAALTGGMEEPKEKPRADVLPEVMVDLDAEYFKWKDKEEDSGRKGSDRKDKRFSFGKR